MTEIGVLLFENFETLDVFGPVEIFGRLQAHYNIKFYSQYGGSVSNAHGVNLLTDMIMDTNMSFDIFLIPGGYGTREAVENEELMKLIKSISNNSKIIFTVCTGSGLLAKTGLLSGKKATSNKRAFDWAMAQDETVVWQKKARWAVDGKYYTSAGVSAGMDMALGYLADNHGINFARKVAYEIEYTWQENKDMDEFYLQNFEENT